MILLCTLNSTYQHSSFGLRYIFANMKSPLQARTKIMEFTIAQKPRDIVEKILIHNPKIVGFGTYIWNTKETEETIAILKRVAPEVLVVLGGPEVSYEAETQNICEMASFVFQGECDFLFPQFCETFFSTGTLPQQKYIRGDLPDIHKIQSPYSYYTDEDIRNRVIYVEASRGCPYKCEYCLSSLDKSVRNFPLEPFLADMQKLIERGAKQFKFVDRTFNLSPSISTKILQFFLDRISLGLFLHFEMVPDRLPEELRALIKQFPAGSLQFEVGIQTWNPQVAANVSRRQDYAKIKENFAFLRAETKVHTHADLIVGLPGETLESFSIGFDALSTLQADEIQVGILKRLKGTPIIRHDQLFKMVYQAHPPFQILSTKDMNFSTLQKMNRFAKFWDLYANSGNFPRSMKLLRDFSASTESKSLFWSFFSFSEFLSERHANSFGISLLSLVESFWIYFTKNLMISQETARDALSNDYANGNKKRDLPGFLKNEAAMQKTTPKTMSAHTPERQRRHEIN